MAKRGSRDSDVSSSVESSSAIVREKLVCGLVMPISAMDNCDEAHWEEVRSIIREALPQEKFDVKLVSQSEEAGIIHRNIVDNLYSNDVVVCDVSAKNPNVMFELGMRLAFDKPVVVIKDDKTNYSFDTSPVEHITYPRDLRFSKIVNFKNELYRKVMSTHDAYRESGGDSGFLSSFGSFKLPQLSRQEVPAQEYIIDQLSQLAVQVERLSRVGRYGSKLRDRSYICLRSYGVKSREEADLISSVLMNTRGVEDVLIEEISPNHFHLSTMGDRPVSSVRRIVENYTKNDMSEL